MIIKKDLVLRKVATTWIVVPVGSKVLSFNGMLQLNESGVMLWNALVNGADKEYLVNLLMSEYSVARVQAEKDVEEYIEKLIEADCLE